ncbi:MAG: DnaJ domain-containing protein [Gloeomargarita sp. SKYBB_i_bin120]|nr:DnaJ domain-containing protein [Gloeomargarita sp. SKYG98]MCS7291479.1 DnaJ domain-containing protein [Gloeomargarita sp. SKYB120]MDW8177039.1 DnaJ domain-containing protein [Gloeomargarita sp. SKYBB_i_bin120]
MTDSQLVQSYRRLGLAVGASLAEVKAAYRRLARQCHPDLHPDDQQSHERFIALHQAYRYLLDYLTRETSAASLRNSVRIEVQRPPTPPTSPPLTPEEQALKHKFQVQWRTLLEQGRFPRAVALLETLRQRFPQDPDIRTWEAYTYQRWGRALIDQGQWDKARGCLKTALRLDPHNGLLWQEVNREFIRLEQRMKV